MDVRLVEAAPVAGALRFELLSEGREAPRSRKKSRPREDKRPGQDRNERSFIAKKHREKPGKSKTFKQTSKAKQKGKRGRR